MDDKERERLYAVEVEARKRARLSDVETSKEAAAPSKKDLCWACLLMHYESPDGLMDEELGDHHPDNRESYRRRGSDLRLLKWTEWLMDADGKPVKRRTLAGGKARVSIITTLGARIASYPGEEANRD